MRVRQSSINLWMSCPLKAKFQTIDLLPTKSGAKQVFGTVMHHALEEYNRRGDLDAAIETFKRVWAEPERLRQHIDVWAPKTSYHGYLDRGIDMLKQYDEKNRWDRRRVIATEHRFLVPIGVHELTGTVDLVEYKKGSTGKKTLKIIDFKTTSKAPTVPGLRVNVQQTCLAPDTPVLLSDMSWKPIGEIEVGDYVIGIDEYPAIGRPGEGSLGRDAIIRPLRRWKDAEVRAVMDVEDEAFELSLSDGHKLIASASHRFLAKREGVWRWRSVADMAEFMFDTRRKTPGVVIARTFRPSDLKIDYDGMDYRAGYLAGVTLGDGSVSGSGPDVLHPFWTLGVGESDAILLARVRAFALSFGIHLYAWEHDPDGRGWQRHTMVGLRTQARADVDALVAMDVGDSKSWKAGWLAGLYDTDGSLRSSNLIYYQRDRAVLERVQQYSADLGYGITISHSKIPYASLQGDRSVKAAFCSLIRPTLARKTERMIGSTSRFFDDVRVMSIRSLGSRRLVDITTSTGTFVADGIVSHNCYIYASLQPEFWMGNGPDFPGMENGEQLYEEFQTIPRRGSFYALWFNREMDCGPRDDADFLRLYRVISEIDKATEQGVFVPNISGETCTQCDFTKQCGLPLPLREEEYE